MKNQALLVLTITTLTLCFGGCTTGPIVPNEVPIDGDIYLTGFYGTLFPHTFGRSNERYVVNNTDFTGVNHEKFDLIHADIGEYIEGTVYCKEEQFEEAKKHYSNPDNYTYFCMIGVHNEIANIEPVLINISDIDTNQFDALIEFAQSSEYDPFDTQKNDSIGAIELPLPDEKVTPQLTFYKESKDGLFVSNKGYKFCIIDNALVFVLFYDYGHGKNEKMIAVQVPAEIGDYVVDFMYHHGY